MASPYLSRRAGSFAWLFQRVSAVLLLVLAFTHFAMQHFTRDAVSTGLTVAARLNDPWFQAAYIVFVVLALFHGINGLLGIVRDYNPRPGLNLLIAAVIWTGAALFAARGIASVLSPTPLAAMKDMYASKGFPAGVSHGNPPATAISYDFHDELRELLLMEFYLDRHTHRTDNVSTAQVFGHAPGTAVDAASISAAGTAFDRWLGSELNREPPLADKRDPHAMFSSSYEFALWAKDVRRANARERLAASTDAVQRARNEKIIERLPMLPLYRADATH